MSVTASTLPSWAASPPLPGAAGLLSALAAAFSRAVAPPRALAAVPSATNGREAGIVRAVEGRDLAEERALCERARAGDRAALGALLRRHGPTLYRSVLLPKLGSEALAQDALGETYARVVERIQQFQWQNCGFYPWLRVVGMRIAIDTIRSRRRETLFDPDDLAREAEAAERALSQAAEPDVYERQDLAEARARVEGALARINPRYATAIRLRVLEERSREEVAATLGVTVPTFDVVLHRALGALKKALTTGDASNDREKGHG